MASFFLNLYFRFIVCLNLVVLSLIACFSFGQINVEVVISWFELFVFLMLMRRSFWLGCSSMC